MGALTSNRKRVDECFSLNSPSFPSGSINSPNYHFYSNKIDTPLIKKPRVSYSNQVAADVVQSQNCCTSSSTSSGGVSCWRTVDRLRKYPEPSGKLKREVHAPYRPRRFGLLSSLRNREVTPLVRESQKKEEEQIMGNVFGSNGSLWRNLEKPKRVALGTFRHVEVVEEERKGRDEVAIEDSDEVIIIEDEENEVRSVDLDEGRGLSSKGLGILLESRDLHQKVSESSVMTARNDLDVEVYKKMLSSVDRSYSDKLNALGSDIKYYENIWNHQKSSRSLKKEQKKEREELKKPGEDLSRVPFLPLTEEEENEVKLALSNSNRRKVLVTHENSNIQITGEVLQCLRPGAWLNDEVINVYLELLKERERRDPKQFLNCHFFNTFFYKKLAGGRNAYDYKSVKRWTSVKKLGYKLIDCEKIFVPIHREIHWCLAVINKQDKKFQYLDSLGGKDSYVLRVLAKYYVDEVKDKCGQDIDVSSWEHEFVEDLPEQRNGFDCGVFMIKYSDFYSRGIGLQFCQEDMPYFRRRTAKEILRLIAD